MGQWSSDLVSAIIVSCNRKELLYNLLSSLNKQSYQQLEKLVVLNSASEKEAQDLKQNFADIECIANKENQLFCRAQNQGIRMARGEFVLCLNDDLTLDEDFVAEMVGAAKRDEQIGMVSGCILREEEDRETVDTTGLFLARCRKPLERGYGRRCKDHYPMAEYIFGAGGVAPLYRRKMLEDVKMGEEYFDEDYGIFYEDLDISWRAKRKNWQAYYTPKALAYHKRGGTVKQIKPRFSILKRYNYACLSREMKLRLLKNRYMTIIKNDRLKSFILNLPWFLLYEARVWLYLILFEPILALSILQDLTFIKTAIRKRRKFVA